MTRNNLFRSLFVVLASAAIGLAPAMQADAQDRSALGGERKTVAVVAVSPYDGLMQDVGYVGQLIGMPNLTDTAEGFINLYSQNKGLVGLDKSRPWGIVATTTGADLSPVVCLPVTDLPALMEVARSTGAKVQELKNGVSGLQVMGQTVFVKAAGQWAFAAQSPVMLDGAPADPQELFAPLLGQYDIGVQFNRQNLPEMFSQLALGQIDARLAQQLRQGPRESQQDFEIRQQMVTNQAKQAKLWITDLHSVQAGLTINPQGGGIAGDYSLELKEGSQLAPLIAAYNTTGGRFSGFRDPGAAVSLASGFQVPADALQENAAEHRRMIQRLRDMAVSTIQQEPSVPNEAVRETLVSVVDDVAAGLEAMVNEGAGDLSITADTRIAALCCVVAVHTPQPERFESALKKLVALIEEDPALPGISWDAENQNGVTFHSFNMPLEHPADQDVFGSFLSIAVGVSEDAFYVALGPQSLQRLRQGIARSQAGPPVEGKPLELSLDLARIAQFATAAAAAYGLPGQGLAGLGNSPGGEGGRVQLTTEGSAEGLKASFRLEDGALKLLVAEAMKQSAQAGPFPPGGEFGPGGGFPPEEELSGGMEMGAEAGFPEEDALPAEEEAADEDPFGADPDMPEDDPFAADPEMSGDDPFGGDPFGN